jgi:polysaccharide biosynthesis/export protein
MKRTLYFIIFLVSTIAVLSSCNGTKQIPYYQNIDNLSKVEITNNFESKIQPDDLLMIIVSAQDPEANNSSYSCWAKYSRSKTTTIISCRC